MLSSTSTIPGEIAGERLTHYGWQSSHKFSNEDGGEIFISDKVPRVALSRRLRST